MHHRATHQTLRIVRRVPAVLLCCAWVIVATGAGCSRKVEKKAPISRYPTLPDKPVAPYLQDTIFHRTEVMNTDRYLVSGYGLVANLDYTGGSEAPTPVRDYMIKQMQQHRIGSPSQPGFENIPPSRILADKRFALVRVDGYLPPGIRAGEYFDVEVSALPESSTTSLARGDLYRTSGPPFNASPWTSAASTPVGTMSLTFTDGNHGTLVYSVNGATVTKPIQRFAFGAVTLFAGTAATAAGPHAGGAVRPDCSS